MNERKPSARAVLALAGLVLLCSVFNLSKAFHIDDVVHLEIARAILRDPLHPMSAEINWRDTAEPLKYGNHPYLVMWLVAAWMSVVGECEVGLHLLMVLFVALAAACTYALARRCCPAYAFWLTAALVLGPAFLPGQNLMLDVPLVAWALLFAWAVMKAGDGQRRFYVLAGAAMAMACLTKYTGVILVPMLIAALAIRRDGRWCWVLLFPVAALAGWSVLNIVDYGGIHLFDRGGAWARPPFVMRLVDTIAGLGALLPATLVAVPVARRSRMVCLSLVAAFFAGVGVFWTCWTTGALGLPLSLLWAVFYANGICVLVLVCRGGFLRRRTLRWWHDAWSTMAVLWIVGVIATCLFAVPFVAVRHLLLAVPPILFLLAENWRKEDCSRGWVTVSLGVTILLGIVLAVSDCVYAGVYRTWAVRLREKTPPDVLVWQAGHWGWQWYAGRAGMEPYDAEHTEFGDEDFLVVPAVVDRQLIRARHWRKLEKVEEYTVPSGPFTWVRTVSRSPAGGYYGHSLGWGGPPWRVSRAPLETFAVYRVGRRGEGNTD